MVITDPGCHIVFVEPDEEAVQFSNTLLVLFKLLLLVRRISLLSLCSLDSMINLK